MVAPVPTIKRHRVSELFRKIAILYNQAKNLNDVWENKDMLQAYHDVFLAAKSSGLISDYSLKTGEVTYKEWR
jgi:hypothetical protein